MRRRYVLAAMTAVIVLPAFAQRLTRRSDIPDKGRIGRNRRT